MDPPLDMDFATSLTRFCDASVLLELSAAVFSVMLTAFDRLSLYKHFRSPATVRQPPPLLRLMSSPARRAARPRGRLQPQVAARPRWRRISTAARRHPRGAATTTLSHVAATASAPPPVE